MADFGWLWFIYLIQRFLKEILLSDMGFEVLSSVI